MKSFLPIVLLLLFALPAFAQTTVRGRVSGADGSPLIGAAVIEQGTRNGTRTDIEGRYMLNTSGNADAVLVFSYTGFTTVEERVNGRTQIDVTLTEGVVLEALEIVGSRSQNRTVTNSPVPVDVIDLRQVTLTQGQLDVNQLLQYTAPSFNSNRQTGADGADHVDPATLRGLGPDQTLVLINGKRRHQSSLVNIYGTRGRGNTGTDLNTIPAAAIERIEILRDGAAAQYGSDAIAGVINIVLKDDVDRFTGNVNVGAHLAQDNPERSGYDAGSSGFSEQQFDALFPDQKSSPFDGENLQLNGNYGFRVGQGGFVNVTADYWHRGHTNRFDPSLYRRRFGDAKGTNFSSFFNASLPVGPASSIYAFGGLSQRLTEAYAWSRDPGSARNVDRFFPFGFDPVIGSNIDDRSLSAGIRSTLRGWNIDFNHTYGKNRFHFYGRNTVNASLEERSPTEFDDGGFQLTQNTSSVGFSQFFQDWLAAGTNLAFGIEHRVENYQIFAGEEGSWRTYGPVPFVTPDGDTVARPGGAQGFPGFAPSNEVDETRTNLGLYVDGEFGLTERLDIGAAARFEDYSDFGSTLNGKVTARLELIDGLAVRASAGTGFRAPSLVQLYFNSIYTDFVSGVAVDKFLARNNSPVTRALGIAPLKEENSVNIGAGLTATFGQFTGSIDYYHVTIDDRIVLTGDFYNDDPEIGSILQELNVGSARFFANAINTTTDGIDVVLSWANRIDTRQQYTLSLAANVNNMTIDEINTNPELAGKEDFFLSNREKLFILASAPPVKGNFTIDYRLGSFGANLRLNYFGELELEDYIGTIDTYEARTTLDLSLAYQLSPSLRLTIGGSNILNAYPTEQDAETEGGGLYDPVQMGFNGAFFFAKLGFGF
jgi:iron complex outermembrane receptor protein